MTRKNILLVSMLLYLSGTMAQIKLPSVLSDGMVLQQSCEAALWGKAAPGKVVSVKTGWDGKTYRTTVANDSTWKMKVKTPAASLTSYTIQFSGAGKAEIKNVLIGEVWLCSGQSNMEMPVKGYPNQPIEGALQDIVDSSNNYLRCYTVKKVSAITRQWDCPGKWEAASPNTTGDFTAAGYYFARQLQKVLRIPVAILHCSWGGSTIEAWISSDAMKLFPNMKIPRTQAENKIRWKSPTVLYNGMLNSLVGYTMRGALWYQGESNRTRYKEYAAQFEAMHKDWIAKWDIGDFPIYFAQLAPFSYEDKRYNCAFMREVQEKIARTQPNTGMVVLMDIGDSICIHPGKKREVGERFACMALARNYGFDKFQYQSPQYSSFEIKDDRIFLKFDYAPLWLTSFYKEITGFKIAGADRKFYPAKALLTRKTLEVYAPEVPEPVAVRYGFEDFVQGTLWGVNGLPVSSFRTDNWDDVIY